MAAVCAYCSGRGLVGVETLCPECNGSGTEHPALPPIEPAQKQKKARKN